MDNKISTKKMIVCAMLVAFDVIFTRVLALNLPLTKIGLGFAAVAVCGMAYGPVWAAVCAGLGDLIGSLLFPTGAYFPGFTLTAAVGGAIFGLALYKQRPSVLRCFLTALCNGIVVSMVLNTAMISFVFGPKLWPLFMTRLPQFGVMLAVQTLVLVCLTRSDTLYGKIMTLRN